MRDPGTQSKASAALGRLPTSLQIQDEGNPTALSGAARKNLKGLSTIEGKGTTRDDFEGERLF